MHDFVIDHGRRRLIQAAGSALLLPAVPAFAWSGSPRAAELTIGVLLPRSAHLPQLGADFLAGLRLGLVQAKAAPINLAISEYQGATPNAGLRQLSALASRDDLLLLTGIADPDAAHALHPVLAEHERPLLLCDAGANIARRPADSPYLSCQSLGYWQSNLAAGHWAAANLGPRAVQATGWRESGYDLPYAFTHGFAAAGGSMLASHVSFRPGQAEAFAGLAETVQRIRPDFVHALYSGSEARAFAAFYRQAGLDAIAPLLGGGFLATGMAGSKAPVLTAASWSGAAAQCSPFAEGCQRTGLQASPYTMLGYEAALRIAGAIDSAGRNGPALAQALAASSVHGPRGTVAEDRSQTTGGMTHWLRSGANERVVATLPLAATAPALVAAVQSTMKSGWAYPYLAA
jgi:ABC-type branched-subunit amino acid transport system substrate-binding protein